jgi:UDP-perosamine 4-acetyltransferase
MSARPDIIVICAGGHGRVVIDILRRAGETVAGLVDADAGLHGKDIDGVRVIGGDEAVFMRSSGEVMLVNARGNAPRTGAGGLDGRRRLYERFAGRGFKFMRVISPDAVVSSAALLEDACHIVTGAIVHPGSVIGMDAIINTGAQIDHDCRIGAHSHVAPGAVLCGNVIVGPECHIGAGAVITQNITIGAGAIVGAGAVVIADVAPGTTTFGVARTKR